jgi:hypothetical protein
LYFRKLLPTSSERKSALIYCSTLKVETRGSSGTVIPADKTEGITSQKNLTLTPLTEPQINRTKKLRINILLTVHHSDVIT